MSSSPFLERIYVTRPSRAVIHLVACTLLLGAQTPAPEVSIRTHAYTPPSAVLHAESNLVETSLTVRDSLGRTIAGLHDSDFEVLDNGVPQPIAGFSEMRRDASTGESPREPKFIIFFFDDLHIGRLELPFLKQAARAFIAKGVKPPDRLAIVTASGAGGLDFTTDAKLFAARLEQLNVHTHVLGPLIRFILDHPEEYQASSISTLAGLGAAAKRLSETSGARILAVMSSGFIIHIDKYHDVETDVQKAIDIAVHCGVVVHAIDSKGLTVEDPRTVAALNRPLREIVQGSGGHFFENTNDLAGAMEQAADPEVTYQVAFNPGKPDGKFHTLKIRFRSKGGDAVEFRPGYLSGTDDAEKRLAARGPMDDAVFSKQTLRDVPATVALAAGQPKDAVSIGITVDVNGLRFATASGRHMQQIVFLMTLLDASGNFVTGKESIMDLALTDGKLASLKKYGLKTVATLNAPPGVYQVRTVVREGMKGGLSASTAPVEVRAK